MSRTKRVNWVLALRVFIIATVSVLVVYEVINFLKTYRIPDKPDVAETSQEDFCCIYFPMLFSPHADLGLYVAQHAALGSRRPDLTIEQLRNNVEKLEEELNPDIYRTGFGNWQDPFDTLYQRYLAGGWENVDEEVVPVLNVFSVVDVPIIFTLMHGGQCTPPPLEDMFSYADFIVEAVERYDFAIVEPWNEVDLRGGLPSLYGCYGYEDAEDFLLFLEYLLDNIRVQTIVGVSFSFVQNAVPFFVQVAETLSGHNAYIGVHNYGLYVGEGEDILYTWSGDADSTVKIAEGLVGHLVDVKLTEYNLREETETMCWEPDFQETQEEVLVEGRQLGEKFNVVFSWETQPSWQCTGVIDSLWYNNIIQER